MTATTYPGLASDSKQLPPARRYAAALPPADFEGSELEWEARVDLAACYRIIAHYGWDDLIATHISVRVPDEHGAFLINDFGLAFDEITASSLAKVDLSGRVIGKDDREANPAGFTIHSAVYAGRRDVGAVIHIHTVDGMAVSTSADGILPITQTAMAILDDVAYHDYEGQALDLAEREHIQADLGAKNLLVLRHHGTLATGDCIATAFVRIYHLEKACSAQVRALAMGTKQALVDPVALSKATLPGGMTSYGAKAWPAVRRMLDRQDPSYRQ